MLTEQQQPEPTYRIVRYTQNRPKRIIQRSVSLAEAQAHCQEPSTRGTTRKGHAWFDGYTKE